MGGLARMQMSRAEILQAHAEECRSFGLREVELNHLISRYQARVLHVPTYV